MTTLADIKQEINERSELKMDPSKPDKNALKLTYEGKPFFDFFTTQMWGKFGSEARKTLKIEGNREIDMRSVFYDDKKDVFYVTGEIADSGREKFRKVFHYKFSVVNGKITKTKFVNKPMPPVGKDKLIIKNLNDY